MVTEVRGYPPGYIVELRKIFSKGFVGVTSRVGGQIGYLKTLPTNLQMDIKSIGGCKYDKVRWMGN